MVKPTSERIDERYSDEKADAVPWTAAEDRLAAAEIAWIVTVRPDGRPHATPMVPVTDEGKVYFHTGSTEVKHANLLANPHVLVLAGDTAWDRGLDVAVEGTAVRVTNGALLRRLAELYRDRWDGRWKLDDQIVAFEVTPDKGYGHAKGDPFGQTNYRF
jgi:general stress protein 26